MATVTRTFSQFNSNVVAVHTGMVAVGGHLSLSVTFSPSGILNMVQVPHGATLLDFWMRVQCAADDDQQTVQIGTSATTSGIMSVTTLTQTITLSASVSLDVVTINLSDGVIRAPGGTRGVADGTRDLMPVRISLSDDAQPRNVWVQGRLGAGISATAYFTFMLFYTMDGLAGRTTIR